MSEERAQCVNIESDMSSFLPVFNRVGLPQDFINDLPDCLVSPVGVKKKIADDTTLLCTWRWRYYQLIFVPGLLGGDFSKCNVISVGNLIIESTGYSIDNTILSMVILCGAVLDTMNYFY